MQKVKRCTLLFPLQWELIWLSRKKLKIGQGLLNGWGGKEEPEDETIEDTAVREVKKETGGLELSKEELDKAAILDFYKFNRHTFEHVFECHVYLCSSNRKWHLNLKETEEMGPGEYYPRRELPYDEMMPADREWLPRILAGERLRGQVFYNEDNTMLVRPSTYIILTEDQPLAA